MSKDLRTEKIPLHRILREVYRHLSEFEDYFRRTGKHIIEHGYFVYDDEGEIVDQVCVAISLWDLQKGFKELSPRKREAMYYNVILDWKQKDVADKMGITTVSVGQYVEQAVTQLAERYFAEMKEEDK